MDVRIEDGIDETDVQVDGEDDRFGEGHGDRSKESHLGDILARHVGGLDLALGLDVIVSSQLP